MAGHSKWANIRHRKAAQDAKRGKVFSKLIRELTVASRQGGAVEDNPRLRTAMEKALAANMKKDTIDKAIARGSGTGDGEQYEELTYEGYGPGGVAIMVACMTDNRNRTVSDVRHAFTKHGGNLGTDGSVAYLFTHRGRLVFDAECDEEALIEASLRVGAEDVQDDGEGGYEVLTAFETFFAVKDGLHAAGCVPAQAETSMVAETTIALDDTDAEKVLALLDMLEDLDDVQQVHSNAEFSDEFLASLEA